MKLVYGGYGHHPSGKQYVYWGDDNLRTGQNVNVPVRNWISGKNYNTMFTIMRTSGGEMGENEATRLDAMGIDVKTVNGTNVMNLPGAADWSSKREWKEWSDLVYEEKNRLGDFAKQDTSQAREQLLGGYNG